jgi:hypothetical protein
MFKHSLSLLSFMTFASFMSLCNARPNNMCNEFNCRYLYSASNVRIDSCNCKQNVHTFAYPHGYKYAEVNYTLSYPVAQEFYQNNTLIGSCPLSLLCREWIPLEPSLRLITTVTEYLEATSAAETSFDTAISPSDSTSEVGHSAADTYDLSLYL